MALSFPVTPTYARLIFTADIFTNEAEIFKIGESSSTLTTDLALEFGGTLTESFTWNSSQQRFNLSSSLYIEGGLEVTGDVNFSGASQFRLREESFTLATPDCLHLNELVVDIDSNKLYICTNVLADTWVLVGDGNSGGGGTEPVAPAICPASIGTCDSSNNGAICFDDTLNTTFMCDSDRNKWLSTTEYVLFGENASTCEQWGSMSSSSGCIAKWGNNPGPINNQLTYYLPHNITVTKIGFSQAQVSCNTNDGHGIEVEIWGTGSATEDDGVSLTNGAMLVKFPDNGQDQYTYTNLNVDVPGDQYIIWGLHNDCSQSIINGYNVAIYYRWSR